MDSKPFESDVLPAELYGTSRGVQLGRKAGNSPVWRFEVERVDNSGATPVYKPLRYVYMTDTANSPVTYNNTSEDQVAGDIEIFFNTGNTTIVQPGRQALIGTRGFEDPDTANSFEVFMGRRTTTDDTMLSADELQEELDRTTRLALNANAGHRYTLYGRTLRRSQSTKTLQSYLLINRQRCKSCQRRRPKVLAERSVRRLP